METLPTQVDDEPVVEASLADNVELGREISGHDFPSLYVRHRSAVAAQARRFLNDPHDVEDVVQETFLRLFLAAPEIENEVQALAFCKRVVVNLCIDRYRAARRRPQLVDLEMAACSELATSDPDQADQIVGAEDAAIVRQALASLTPLHRAALVKREIEEKPLSVIAGELEVPEDSVKHLLFRARRSLRRLLAGTSAEPGRELGVDPGKSLISLAGSRLAQASGHGLGIAAFFVLAVGGVAAAVTTSGGGSTSHAVMQGSAVPNFLGPGQHHIRVVPPMAGGTAKRHHQAPARTRHTPTADKGAAAAQPTPVSTPTPTAPAPKHHVVHRAPQKAGHHPHHHAAAVPAPNGTVNYGGTSVPAMVVSQPRTNVGNTRSISTSQVTAPIGAQTFMLSQRLVVDGSSLPKFDLTVNLPGAGTTSLSTVDMTLAFDQRTQTWVVDAVAPLTGPTPGTLQVHVRYDTELQAPVNEQIQFTPGVSSNVAESGDSTASGQAS